VSETVSINTQRSIGNLDIDCTILEQGTDNYTATRHPVEQGASITDHVYREPAQLVMKVGFSNSSSQAQGSESYVVDTYKDLLAMQADRTLLEVVTGKRTYQNMIITSLSVPTDNESETTLFCNLTLTELIIVSTQVTTVPSSDKQANPQQTGALQQLGVKQLTDATLSVSPINLVSVTDIIKEVPLIPATAQTFGTSLNNVTRQLTTVWRDVQSSALGDLSGLVGGGWSLDIGDLAGSAVASGLPLITGANLLDQLEYLGLDAKLVVQTTHDVLAVPTFDNLGLTSHLYAALLGG
jgi:hypothetical protein